MNANERTDFTPDENDKLNADESFAADETRLTLLLRAWDAPAPPAALDARLLHSFRQQQQENNSPARANETMFSPQSISVGESSATRSNLEAVMKQCAYCDEEFSDKFSFCPVDGTPLNDLAAAITAQPAPATNEPPRRAVTLVRKPLLIGDGFRPTIMEDTGLLARLAIEVRNVAHSLRRAAPEFRRDPAGFTRRITVAVPLALWNLLRSPHVAVAVLTGVLIVTSAIIAVVAFDSLRATEIAQNTEEQLTIEQIIDTKDIPKEEEKPKKEGAAGNDKGKGGGSKEKQEKPQGGGGGGRENEPKPPSPGKLPVASLDKPIVSPSVNPPPPRPPLLAVPPTVRADPKLFPPDTRNIPFGTPGATGKEPSPGAGTGSGMGGGTGSGVGTGDGSGVGAGRDYNTGGGDGKTGGGGHGGGGDGVDVNKIYTTRDVTLKAVITAKPEPQYTEEARKNQVQGTVTLRVALMANGSVGSIRAVSSLPSGLTEKAIAAARGIRFRPAQKSGTAVSQWIQVEYNFNLY